MRENQTPPPGAQRQRVGQCIPQKKTAPRRRHRLALAGVLAICACIGPEALADSRWLTRVWQSDDGLPNNEVTGIAQTSDGYLWIANMSRLARFDGDHFESFSSRAIFPAGNDARILLALRGRDNALWLGVEHGPLIRLRDGTQEVFTNNLPPL